MILTNLLNIHSLFPTLDFLGNDVNHLMVMSIFIMSFADIEKHAIFLSVMTLRFISSINSSSVKAPSRSFLLPKTRSGMPDSEGHDIN